MARRHRTKVPKKEDSKSHQISIHHQKKKIHLQWYQNSGLKQVNQVTTRTCIFSLLLPSGEKIYIKIDTPPRQKAWGGAKYIVTVPSCHWICKRNVTAVALIAYVIQRAQVARNNLKTAIKEAPTEEILHAKIAEYGCYIKLVKIIVKGITTQKQVQWYCILPHMQQTFENKTQIQNSQKSISIQNVQRLLRPHRRWMGAKLLYGRWFHKTK